MPTPHSGREQVGNYLCNSAYQPGQQLRSWDSGRSVRRFPNRLPWTLPVWWWCCFHVCVIGRAHMSSRPATEDESVVDRNDWFRGNGLIYISVQHLPCGLTMKISSSDNQNRPIIRKWWWFIKTMSMAIVRDAASLQCILPVVSIISSGVS